MSPVHGVNADQSQKRPFPPLNCHGSPAIVYHSRRLSRHCLTYVPVLAPWPYRKPKLQCECAWVCPAHVRAHVCPCVYGCVGYEYMCVRVGCEHVCVSAWVCVGVPLSYVCVFGVLMCASVCAGVSVSVCMGVPHFSGSEATGRENLNDSGRFTVSSSGPWKGIELAWCLLRNYWILINTLISVLTLGRLQDYRVGSGQG